MTEHLARDRIRHFTYNAQATEFTMMMAALAMIIVIEGACYTIALLFLAHGLVRGICSSFPGSKWLSRFGGMASGIGGSASSHQVRL